MKSKPTERPASSSRRGRADRWVGSARSDAADKPIKFGVHTILSGPFADFGQLGVNGFNLAVEELNAKAVSSGERSS